MTLFRRYSSSHLLRSYGLIRELIFLIKMDEIPILHTTTSPHLLPPPQSQRETILHDLARMQTDAITALPWEIQDSILGRLPIKDSIATNILSRHWRDRWMDVSALIIEEELNENGLNLAEFSRRVYQILRGHRGTIEELVLSCRSNESVEIDVPHWLQFLSKHKLRSLNLKFSPASPSPQIPTSILSECVQLTTLSMTNCSLWIPHYALTFSRIVTLSLTKCECNDTDLQSIIKNSENLKYLTLSDMAFGSLSISAPNLTNLYLEGRFRELCLESSCQDLSEATIIKSMVAGAINENDEQQVGIQLLQSLDWMSTLHRFVTSGGFLKFLAARCHGGLVCQRLEILELEGLNYFDSDQMRLLAALLSSSSNLKKLLIKGHVTYKDTGLERIPAGIYQFEKMQTVRLQIFITPPVEEESLGGQETPYTELIQLLLAGSPKLKEMILHYIHVDSSDKWLLKKLLTYEAASPVVKVKYCLT